LEVFVGMPKLLLAQTKMNKKMNAKRQETLVAGRKAARSRINVHRDGDQRNAINLDAAVVNPVQFISQSQQQQPVGQGQAHAQQQPPRQGQGQPQQQPLRQGPVHPQQQGLVQSHQQPPRQGQVHPQQHVPRQGPIEPQHQLPRQGQPVVDAPEPAGIVPQVDDPTAQYGELAPIARYNAEDDARQRQEQHARDR
jgi:hypothetical protein